MHYLVVGGNGFLGKSICSFLLDKQDAKVSIFDVVLGDVDERVIAIKGDITDAGQVKEALKGIDVVFHTASPIHGKPAQIYHKVNVLGSQNILKACQESPSVTKLIFTSSAGVVYNGQDLYNVDETLGYCDVHMDAYNETKAIAEELILAGNGKDLLTCAIRPSGIFGPRDAQGSLAVVESAKRGQSSVMIGLNQNLFDLTYVDNVSHAHILAADKMEIGSGIEGQAFFITNDQPIFFWDYPKILFDHLGYKNTHSIQLSTTFAFILGDIMDGITWLLSPFKTLHPSITRFRVTVINGNRYYDISKAKKLLGYKPIVGLMEGFKLTADYWKAQGFGVDL